MSIWHVLSNEPAGLERQYSFQDTPQVLPCRLGRVIPDAYGPGRSTVTLSGLCDSEAKEPTGRDYKRNEPTHSYRISYVGNSEFQSGTSPFGARGLLPGPFATRRCKKRPQGGVHALSRKEAPCCERAPPQVAQSLTNPTINQPNQQSAQGVI